MWVRSLRVAGHNTTALALGLLLASFADENGVGIRVSLITLATMMGVSVRTVNRHLDALTEGGWVKVGMIQTETIESLRLAMPKK